MNRTQLDAFVANHKLAVPAIDNALILTSSRPKAPEWRAFTANSLILAGVTAAVSGLIFFVAANWQDMGLLGRFALLQALLLGCMGLAWWQAPQETAKGKQIFTLALVGATFVTGTLLALFGQTYQTGADVYELFFGWALLTLPFALGAKSDALWIIWACILNVGLALLCGWGAADSFGWRIFNRFHMDKAWVLLIPFAINGLGALYSIISDGWKAPKYHARGLPSGRGNLRRVLLTFSLAYGTAAGLAAIITYRHRGTNIDHAISAGIQQPILLTLLILSCAALTWHTLKQKRDVYPLALVAAVSIIISTALIFQMFTQGSDFGVIFFIGFWIIGASTAAGIVLMHYVRAWHVDPDKSTAPIPHNMDKASTT